MLNLIFNHLNLTTALIALALGYLACVQAKKEAGILKATGYVIGIAIIIISTVLTLIVARLMMRVVHSYSETTESSSTITTHIQEKTK